MSEGPYMCIYFNSQIFLSSSSSFVNNFLLLRRNHMAVRKMN
jgi:hypothetical protein